ncbi:39S ribosomal protein L50, mitochondrial-like [Stegodyphus dumicola]|uniref:39S ribosomal protein L50, mitochondrial-like n=1 Tax=Stegodyphus dumicola TaxID=202533 RepID=UPI0015A7E1A4|nr:39S ribosomal protein L50, mitochondrial-like [Stegodyphus dumicola]
MNAQVLYSLFSCYRTAVQNLRKTCVANACLNTSKGTRKMRKARKYRRPEDLEDPFYYGIGPKPEVKAVCQSIAARGFAKEQPSYQPPSDVEEQLHQICKKIFGSQLNPEWKRQTLDDRLLKYKVLTKTIQQLNKHIPNSLLYKIKDVEDILTYFSTPVDGLLHYDALVRDQEKLPPNLCVLPDTSVFNPETDTFFEGVTAFPGRKRIIYTKTGEKLEKTIQWPNI